MNNEDQFLFFSFLLTSLLHLQMLFTELEF